VDPKDYFGRRTGKNLEEFELKPGISILVPCLNESGNIEATFQRISKALAGEPFEVVFIDDGSSDTTENEISEIVSSYPLSAKLVSHKVNQGIPWAWKSGLDASKYDTICLIDGDLQNPPEAIPHLMQILQEQQVDVVQGSRSSIGRLKDQRLIFSRGLNFLLNKTFRQDAVDSKSGFLVSTKQVLKDVFVDIPKFKHFQTFIGVGIRARGFRVVEAETLFLSREIGTSFLTSSKTFEVLLTTIRDIAVGLRVYGRRRVHTIFLRSEVDFDIKLTLGRRIRLNLFFGTMPLHKWIISKRAKSFYLWLKGLEFSSKDEIDRLQLRRLRSLLQHAYLTVPYYKRAFDAAGFKPNQIESIADLSKIPLLSKQDVRENVHFAMFSDLHNKKEMHKINTSGSTGEPFVCYADKFQLEMRFATTLRALEMSGWKFGDKQLRLWHQTLGMSRTQAFKERLDAWFMRRHFIPAFEMSEVSLKSLIKTIEKKKPVLIDGYAESLNFIAIASTTKSKHNPLAVMSSAQQLTDSTRAQIEKQFGAKVLDKYGSREFSGIAYQCLESPHHHVQDESYILEILVDGRTAKAGEVGEVVITDLNNFSMPLIRYRIGDMAIAVDQVPCECGRPHSQIGAISGRTQALISCTNGVWLPGTFFAHFFKDFDFAIQHYQITQETSEKFTLKIVPKSQFTDEVKNRIVEDLKTYTGQGQIIEVSLVEEIPLLKTGKRTPVVSNVKLDFQQIDNTKIILS
jgi:phenylacetate-CoA ligase